MAVRKIAAVFAAYLSVLLIGSLGLALVAASALQTHSTAPPGTASGATTNVVSASVPPAGDTMLLGDKKKKKKKEQKRKQRQQRQVKKNERRANREQKSNAPNRNAPSRHQQPTRVGAQPSSNDTQAGAPQQSRTVVERNKTETKWNGNSVTVKHDVRSAKRESVEGSGRAAPPKPGLNRMPVQVNLGAGEAGFRKFGTEQANVKLLGAQFASTADFGGGQVSVRGSVALSVVSAHAERTFAGPMGNVKTKIDASLGVSGAAAAKIGKNGVSVGVEAFAGVRATGQIAYGVQGIEAVATAEIQAGLGFAADGGAQWVDGKITFNWKVGAAIGVGGKLAGNLVIDPGKAVQTVSGAAEDVADVIEGAGAAAVGAVSDIGETVTSTVDAATDVGAQALSAVGRLFDW